MMQNLRIIESLYTVKYVHLQKFGKILTLILSRVIEGN